MKHPKERILVAIDASGNVHVLHGKGPAFECDVDAVGMMAGDMGLDTLPAGAPSYGLVVMDCVPEAMTSPPTLEHESEFDGYDYHHEATCRRPTSDELSLIVKGEYAKLTGYWSDIQSREDWEKKQPAKGHTEEEL